MKQTMSVLINFFDSKSTEWSLQYVYRYLCRRYTLVDWTFGEEAKKEHPEKLRYVLRDLAAKEGAFAYEYTGYLANIHSVESYYQANKDMLESHKFYSLFTPNQKIYTKVKNEEPTYYANTSKVSTSQFASGSIIEGKWLILFYHVIFMSIRIA